MSCVISAGVTSPACCSLEAHGGPSWHGVGGGGGHRAVGPPFQGDEQSRNLQTWLRPTAALNSRCQKDGLCGRTHPHGAVPREGQKRLLRCSPPPPPLKHDQMPRPGTVCCQRFHASPNLSEFSFPLSSQDTRVMLRVHEPGSLPSALENST